MLDNNELKYENSVGEITPDSAFSIDDMNPKQEQMFENKIDRYRDYLKKEATTRRDEPLSQSTIDNYPRRVRKILRIIYSINGDFKLNITVQDAEQFEQALVDDNVVKRNGKDYAESTKRRDLDALSRFFDWRSSGESGGNWHYETDFNEVDAERDYFTREEREMIRAAALEYKTTISYKSASPEQRDQWKTYLSQSLGKPKDEISPEDWNSVNTDYKWVSLFYVSLDAALRPCEVKRATIDWYHPEKGALLIPKADSAKSREQWEVALTADACSALDKWLDQRKNLTEYDEKDEIWLNRQGNPFNSGSLNYNLNNLMELMDIDAEDRDLSWYSIRHSTGTYYETEDGLAGTAEQLRHKSLETTRKYTHTPIEERQKNLANI